MCTLAVYFQVFPGYPLVLAANRDEFLARPSRPPGPLDPAGRIFGGRDDLGGGTWFGVNQDGLVAALLNRRTDEAPHPDRRSRGLLCLDALRHQTATAARSWALGESPDSYNPFNLLVADPTVAWVCTNHAGRLSITPLSAGLHLLTNLDLNDPTCPRIATSYGLFARLIEDGISPDRPGFVADVQKVLASHETPLDPRASGAGNSLCLHAAEYGTRSSSVVWLDHSGRWTYFHSDDPPCRATLVRQSLGGDPLRRREA